MGLCSSNFLDGRTCLHHYFALASQRDWLDAATSGFPIRTKRGGKTGLREWSPSLISKRGYTAFVEMQAVWLFQPILVKKNVEWCYWVVIVYCGMRIPIVLMFRSIILMRSTRLTLCSVVLGGCRWQHMSTVLLIEVLKIVVSSRVRCVWFDDKRWLEAIHYKYHTVVVEVLPLSFRMKNHGHCQLPFFCFTCPLANLSLAYCWC